MIRKAGVSDTVLEMLLKDMQDFQFVYEDNWDVDMAYCMGYIRAIYACGRITEEKYEELVRKYKGYYD